MQLQIVQSEDRFWVVAATEGELHIYERTEDGTWELNGDEVPEDFLPVLDALYADEMNVISETTRFSTRHGTEELEEGNGKSRQRRRTTKAGSKR